MSNGDIIMVKVNTHDNPMNAMTKLLCILTFEHCLKIVGVCC